MSRYFFKVLVGEWTTKLRIPQLFVSSFNLTPKTVILIGASSKGLWKVDIEEEEEGNCTELYFKKGWIKFVKDNALEAADFLIFKFDGNSRFKVIICGKSACEKKLESQALAHINQNKHKQHHNKQTAPTRDRRENQKRKDPIYVETQKLDVTIKEEEADFDFDDDGTSSQETWDETWAPQSEDEDEEEEEKEEESDVSDSIGQGSNLGSMIPSFRVCLQRAYAKQGCMCIPTEFFKKYIRKKRQEVEIETVKGVWIVTLLPHMKRTRTFARFSKGWSQFARTNQFEAGQTLHFKMIRGGNCPKFMVHISK